MTNENYIDADLNLPQHTNEIILARDGIETIKNNLKSLQSLKKIDDKTFIAMYERTVQLLDYVGELSKPAFDVCDKLELMYTCKYPTSPKLAKKLWLDHYDSLHKKYNTLKNRCFRILDELDELYLLANKKQPPNWNI